MADNNTTDVVVGDMIEEHFKGKNVVMVADNHYRSQLNGDRPTNKNVKKKKHQVLQKGRHFCVCGFVITSQNGVMDGMNNMRTKLRLHQKVCPNKK